jgi:rpsU-divergently transcribed protein
MLSTRATIYRAVVCALRVKRRNGKALYRHASSTAAKDKGASHGNGAYSFDSSTTIKEQLLESSLRNVHQYGWTQESIIAAVPAGASLSIAGLLTPNDLVHGVLQQFYDRLARDLHEERAADSAANTESAHHRAPSQRIIHAIQIRLSYQKEYIASQTWHQAMALGASPENALPTQQQLKEQLDLIVQYAYNYQPNDSAVASSVSDIAKFALGGIYVATELHMLTDTSADYVDTWLFLEQRVREWEQATQMTGGLSTDALYVPFAVASAFASGLASLLPPVASQALTNVNSPLEQLQQSASMLPSQMLNAFLSQPTSNVIDATDPRFYDVVKKP